ncbi:MAG: thiamine pyrophosphate-binding protein [Rhodospirillaceae bacterium]|nr:thiamine pyrophosphate-binding protein [Rhodospirillaceae bacterium]MBT4489301.1 thiamine pyrophosphate-binding protein [Rhodospirillaceae bacterium]MBT5194590.1 thiamine pyrophosphate-binding protein [Rhodospirillaceae bacterium]MBT5897457.1 thiamine pyrophosphate-binding protein [Rhodospirillaceae bacterium]MBT6427501.1 thiamine pyrophosphate-binding protein [Rhodospirillaceae bacterium]
MSSEAKRNSITGRSAFLALLKDEGVTKLFGNPGTTELPIMHAMTEQSDISYVLGLQEAIVVAMADGYARATGEIAAVNVHVAPGLGNAMGALYTANFSGSPVIITAGQQEQGHGLTEPLLYAPLVPIAQPLVKWAVEVNRIEDLPRIMRRAAKVALTPPTGPVFISLPGDILNMEAAIDLGECTRVDAATRPSDGALEQLAARLAAAERPVIVAGHEIVASDAFAEAAQLAEMLGAPVYQQTVNDGAHFPTEHPAFMGSLNRDQGYVRGVLSGHDTLICLGADLLRMSVYSEVDPLPGDMTVIQIGQRDWEMGKNHAVDLALRADVKETVKALLPVLAATGGGALEDRAKASLADLSSRNWSAQRQDLTAKFGDLADASPIEPDWLMMSLVDLLPDNAIVVDEGIISTRSLLKFLPIRDRYGYFGNASGGIGWGIAAALGVQIAHPDRRVVAVLGDGSAMYSIQALWTAAHLKLPITFVIANNGGYRIIKERLLAFHGNDQFIAMDFKDPAIEFADLAASLGMRSERIETGAAFETAFRSANDSDGPVLLEVVVQGGKTMQG